MSRQSYPDEDWRSEFSRRGQRWITDAFVDRSGVEGFMRAVPFWTDTGYALSDLNRAFENARTVRMGIDELAKVGDHLHETAREMEAAGRRHTALEFYHRAALCYLRSSWGIPDAEDQDKLDRHHRGIDAFSKVIELNRDYDMAKVEIRLPDLEETMPGIFHKCGDASAPTVLQLPGMDIVKEEVPNPRNNRFVQRGVNVLTIDGPGQGETRLRGIPDDDYERYQRAGSAAIDWLVEQPEVDPDRIGVFGLSMGTYWGPRIAYEDDRVSALATYMGSWFSKDALFNRASPFFKQRYIYMSGFQDEEAFDEYARDMTLYDLDESIAVPTFIAHGEYDLLQSREQAKAFYEWLDGPKELHLYENGQHPVSNAATDILCDAADWFLRVWNGEVGDDHEVARLMPDYPTRSYVPSPKFEFLEQDDRPG